MTCQRRREAGHQSPGRTHAFAATWKFWMSVLLVAWACRAGSGYAAEGGSDESNPRVTEARGDNGVSIITVRGPDGRLRASYPLDLSRHYEPATNRTEILRRWEGYRLGGFVCFNDNQFTCLEFSTNTNAALYNPADLDVAGWAKTMKKAGMRYAVLTTRHTSGFLLWDSDTTEFDVGSSPRKTDVVGEFVRQCRKQGIAPGLYYCLWGGKDWMPHPNARAIILAQLCELATRYGEIPYFWIDMKLWAPTDLSAQEIYDALKLQQPKAVVILNQHIQDGSEIRYFPTDVMNGEVTLPPAGGHNPFREVKGKRYYLPFEFEPVSQRIEQGTTTPLGPVGAWFTYGEGRGFAPSRPLEAGPLAEWIQQAYARGAANVLLSLAPDHTGRMRPEDVRQLEEVGRRVRAGGRQKR